METGETAQHKKFNCVCNLILFAGVDCTMLPTSLQRQGASSRVIGSPFRAGHTRSPPLLSLLLVCAFLPSRFLPSFVRFVCVRVCVCAGVRA